MLPGIALSAREEGRILPHKNHPGTADPSSARGPKLTQVEPVPVKCVIPKSGEQKKGKDHIMEDNHNFWIANILISVGCFHLQTFMEKSKGQECASAWVPAVPHG